MSGINLLIFGAGYTASYIAAAIGSDVDNQSKVRCIAGTTRSEGNFPALQACGIEPLLFKPPVVSPQLQQTLQQASHIIVSTAPDAALAALDPVLDSFGLDTMRRLLAGSDGRPAKWLGYLSTVGVYGDASGQWVNEQSPCHPGTLRSQHRLQVEQQWLELAAAAEVPLAVFRLPGIYGPGRNALVNLQRGRTRRIVKDGQVFNRAHVHDIARAVQLALLQGVTGIYNICDDLPCPAPEVISFAAQLMGVELPPPVKFEDAELSPMARSFYSESKRVSNSRSRTLKGMDYQYPDYQSGLTALWESGAWNQR